MVTNVGSLGRSGVADFVLQRVSAVVLIGFGLCVGGWFVVNPQPTHAAFTAWFTSPAMSLFATLAVAALGVHAWIGMWTVGTDYFRPHYFGRFATLARSVWLGGSALLTFLYVAWGLAIVWRLL